MTTEHPITPTPELVRQWHDSWFQAKVKHLGSHEYIATQAARWGADQELKACCEYIQHEVFHGFATDLRAARRPKPPSLKQQALEALDRQDLLPTAEDQHIIRRALEQLDD